MNSLVEGRVKKAVTSSWRRRDSGNTQDPDLLVAFHTGVQDKTDVQSWGYGFGHWGMRGGGVLEITYQKGSLILDSIDPKSKDLIRRGVGKKVLSERTSPEERKDDQHRRRADTQEYPPSS